DRYRPRPCGPRRQGSTMTGPSHLIPPGLLAPHASEPHSRPTRAPPGLLTPHALPPHALAWRVPAARTPGPTPVARCHAHHERTSVRREPPTAAILARWNSTRRAAARRCSLPCSLPSASKNPSSTCTTSTLGREPAANGPPGPIRAWSPPTPP